MFLCMFLSGWSFRLVGAGLLLLYANTAATALAKSTTARVSIAAGNSGRDDDMLSVVVDDVPGNAVLVEPVQLGVGL